MEKLWFPGFVLLFEAVVLVLFGTLVEYDDGGAPLVETDLNASGGVHTLASSRTTSQVYPCEYFVCLLRHTSYTYARFMEHPLL